MAKQKDSKTQQEKMEAGALREAGKRKRGKVKPGPGSGLKPSDVMPPTDSDNTDSGLGKPKMPTPPLRVSKKSPKKGKKAGGGRKSGSQRVAKDFA